MTLNWNPVTPDQSWVEVVHNGERLRAYAMRTGVLVRNRSTGREVRREARRIDQAKKLAGDVLREWMEEDHAH